MRVVKSPGAEASPKGICKNLSFELNAYVCPMVMADGIAFYAAEYISAGLHVLDSCSTYASDLGAIFKYVQVCALSLTCYCLLPARKSVFLS